MKYTATLLALLVFMFCVGLSRAQNPRKQERSQPDEDRLIITTSLVQVDAVVTDKTGRQITDLRPNDFEIVEGGRARDIVGFSYVGLSSTSPESAAKNKSAALSKL